MQNRIGKFGAALLKHAATGMFTLTKEDVDERLSKCNMCGERDGNICKVCGCYLDAKLWFASEDCPLNLWPKAQNGV